MLLLLLAQISMGGKVLVVQDGFGNEASWLRGAGHSVTTISSSSMNSKSTSYYLGFDALVISDMSCSGPTTGSLNNINTAKGKWSPAMTGRLVIHTADPGCHSKSQFVINTVDWVIKGGAPGLVVTGDWGRVKMNFMSSFGSFSSVTQHQSNWTRNIPSHAIYSTPKALGTNYMKSWGNTTHSYLSAHPKGLDWKV
ncbi:MAG: hypothetical protein ACI9MC_001402, partial [Kiritimatiellia bacterium]